MLSIEQRNQAYLNWIEECNRFNPQEYLPFFIDNTVLGYVHQANKGIFTEFSDIFILAELFDKEAVSFHPSIDDFDSRTRAANEVARDWRQNGVLKSWVGEQYNVNTGFNHKPFFTIERAAASLLGIKKYGVHVNAWVQKPDGVYLWVARRAQNKPTFPGKLDHLVAGGHGVGYTIEQTLIKECAEEANVPENIARTAKPVSMVSYAMDIGQRLQQDNLFVYDLLLEDDFIPENTDGEAEEFFLWSMEKVMATVATTREYKTNCNLVIIDFAIRHGFLKPDEPWYSDLCTGLHRQL